MQRDAPVVCRLGTIAAGRRAIVRVAARTTRPGAVRNTATLQAAGDAAIVGGGRAVATTRVRAGRVRLTLHARLDRASVRPGGRVGYRVAIRNRGPAAALRARLCVRLPLGAAIAFAAGARISARTACWRLATLPAGRTRTLRLRLRAPVTPAAGADRIVAIARAANAPRHVASIRLR